MTLRLLLLAGTREARDLADLLAGNADWHVTASLAGVTVNPAHLAANTRTGGFGGAKGLADYLKDNSFDAVVDATHPFANQISANAAEACTRQDIALLRVERPPWVPPADAFWINVATLEDAARELPAGARAFLTVGSNSLAAFAHRDDVRFLIRALHLPGTLPFKHCEMIVAPPSSDAGREATLMEEHGITHLVTKNAGGPAGAKLEAAASLKIPTIMVDRPAVPGGQAVTSVQGAIEWLDEFAESAR